MPNEFRESDWKVFRKLREVALERFCGRFVAEVQAVTCDEQLSNFQRYQAICSLVDQKEEELALTFDNPRRSIMFEQLVRIRRLEVLEPQEFAQFHKETRDAVETVIRIFAK